MRVLAGLPVIFLVLIFSESSSKAHWQNFTCNKVACNQYIEGRGCKQYLPVTLTIRDGRLNMEGSGISINNRLVNTEKGTVGTDAGYDHYLRSFPTEILHAFANMFYPRREFVLEIAWSAYSGPRVTLTTYHNVNFEGTEFPKDLRMSFEDCKPIESEICTAAFL